MEFKNIIKQPTNRNRHCICKNDRTSVFIIAISDDELNAIMNNETIMLSGNIPLHIKNILVCGEWDEEDGIKAIKSILDIYKVDSIKMPAEYNPITHTSVGNVNGYEKYTETNDISLYIKYVLNMLGNRKIAIAQINNQFFKIKK